MSTIYYLCPDDNHPIGGIKVLYRHVDILNRAGFRAFIVHKKKGFRCDWFENETSIVSARDFSPDVRDWVVIPEVYGPRAAAGVRGPRKVIFNQNAYLTFKGYAADGSETVTPYVDPEVVAALAVSDDNCRYLRYAFPSLRVARIHLSVDGDFFRFRPLAAKQSQIAFMPRKHPEDAAQVLHILRFRGVLDGFRVIPIDNKSEREVAEILAESLIFLSFGYPEGCPAPPLEAMLSGCLVVGYHGMGGREYFSPEVTWPVEIGDIVGFAQTVEQVLSLHRTSPETLGERTVAACDLVRSEFSRDREASDVVTFWREMQEGER